MAEDNKESMTIEELQAKLLEAEDKNEKLEAEKEALNTKLGETESSLKKSRDLNAKFFAKGVVSTESPTVDEGSKEETQDEFIDSFIAIAGKKMKSDYGDEYFAKF